MREVFSKPFSVPPRDSAAALFSTIFVVVRDIRDFFVVNVHDLSVLRQSRTPYPHAPS